MYSQVLEFLTGSRAEIPEQRYRFMMEFFHELKKELDLTL